MAARKSEAKAKAPSRSKSKSRSKKKAPAAKKSKAKKARKPARASTAKAKKSKRPVKARASARKAPAKKKKRIVGEGDYQASRKFLKDQSDFVKRNKSAIPGMGKAAEKALEGPEGDALREAEATAADRSRDNFDS